MHAIVAAICPAACRFALLRNPSATLPVLSNYAEYPVAGLRDILHAFRTYSEAIGTALPKRLALAVAAPLKGEAFVITQSGWRISPSELKAAFGFEQIVPVNDAAAVGLSLGAADFSDAVPLGGAVLPTNPLPAGRYALINLDSGLGVSGVMVDADGLAVADTEAGHLTFAPENDLEEALAAGLRRMHGRVSYERLLSWEALGHIRSMLPGAEPDGERLSSLEVVLRAQAGDPLSVQAMGCYAEVLGGFAGDVALAKGLTGGVFLTGRYIFEAIDHTDWAAFRRRFEAKGRLSDFVKALPTWALANPASVLIGAARKLSMVESAPQMRSVVAAKPAAKRPQQHMTSDLMQGAVCGLLLLDPDLKIMGANSRFWKGASAPEPLRAPGKAITAAFQAMAGAGDWSAVDAAVAVECLRSGRPYTLERKALGGALLQDDARLLDDGCWVITSQDVTRSARRAQELESLTAELRQARGVADAANRTKSVFLATMSHEIRTPLNGVLGMAQAIANDELSPVQRDRVEIIRQSGEALLAILNDILDLSKIEAGQLTLEDVEFDLESLLLGAHAAFTALANKKGLSFTLKVAPDAKGRYRGDPTRIRQILYNVVSNALKFTDMGEVRVTADQQDGDLRLTVADTGIGVAPERLTHLFERFVQADASTTRKYGGTGLGLAICRELAEMMHGSITAESQPGRGTTIHFKAPIPRVSDADRLADARPLAVEPAASPPASLRVLAAEDNPVNRLVLKTLLHQLGIEPTCVEDGEAAVEAWRSGDWDVILMDIQMPKMDGVEATRRIRALEAELTRPRTPIVALTANVMSHQVGEYLEAGMDTHVSKPIQAGALFHAIIGLGEGADAEPGPPQPHPRRREQHAGSTA